MSLEEHDIYVVRSDVLLGDIDKKVLTYLYQPLVGVESIGLYNTFWGELDHYKLQGEKKGVINLSKILKLSLQKMEICLRKIEAVGLLRTYVKDHEGIRCFVFDIQPPLPPENFINDDILGPFLKGELGEEYFKETLDLFRRKKFNKQNLSEVTSAFDDIYRSCNPDEIVFKEEGLIKGRIRETRVINTSAFNVKLFLNLIKNKDLIIPSECLTNEVINIIAKLAIVYNYNEKEMVRMVGDSFYAEQGVDCDRLREHVRKAYSLTRSTSGPKMYEREMVEPEKNGLLTDLEKKFIETTPREIIKAYFNGGVPPSVDLNVIEEVLLDIKLKPEVVNVLIDYIMKTNNKNFSKGYVLKIAAQWKRLGVDNVKKAMAQAKEQHKNKKEYQKKLKEIKEREQGEDKPDWAEQESGKGEEMTEEELSKKMEKIRKMLNE